VWIVSPLVRPGCLARAEPPVTRPLGLDEMATGLSAFDFQ
jgi:predicted transcriptional regulator